MQRAAGMRLSRSFALPVPPAAGKSTPPGHVVAGCVVGAMVDLCGSGVSVGAMNLLTSCVPAMPPAPPLHLYRVHPHGPLSGVRLRAGLTGRNAYLAGFPGFHPGLVELALQAEIARGAGEIDVIRRILT